MTEGGDASALHILLVEDSPGDVELTLQAFKEGKVRNTVGVARDGVQALQYLHHEGPFAGEPTPDLILLDLNMPKLNGREVLAEIKQDEALKHIPVVILTTSRAEADIHRTYELHA